jgi:hypothetical protein
MLDVDHFRGGVGPFSSLEVLAPNEGSLEYGEGSYRRCASPSRPPPRPVLGLRRLSIQPREPVSCLWWFAVDVFVDESGDIRAVTLDLWEPQGGFVRTSTADSAGPAFGNVTRARVRVHLFA